MPPRVHRTPLRASAPHSSPSRTREVARARRTAATLLAVIVLVPAALAACASQITRLTRIGQRVTLRLSGAERVADSSVVYQRTVYDCGPAALANLMHSLGVTPPPVDSLALEAGTSVRGTTLAGLRRAARSHALPLALTYSAPTTGTVVPAPSVSLLRSRHIVAVTHVDHDGTLTMVDPLAGRYRVSARWFAVRWTGYALQLDRASAARSA